MSTSCNLVVDKRQFGIRNHDLQGFPANCYHMPDESMRNSHVSKTGYTISTA